MNATDQIRANEETRLQVIAADVAAGLGLAIKPRAESDLPCTNIVSLIGPAGELVSLQAGGSGASWRGKLQVSGSVWRVNPYGSKVWIADELSAPSIFVSLAKTPADIIRDIKRRFWGAYVAELDAMRARVAEYDRECDTVRERAQALAAVVGADARAKANGDGPEMMVRLSRSRDLPDAYADITVREHSVTFDKLQVSHAVAAQILAIMAKAAQK